MFLFDSKGARENALRASVLENQTVDTDPRHLDCYGLDLDLHLDLDLDWDHDQSPVQASHLKDSPHKDVHAALPTSEYPSLASRSQTHPNTRDHAAPPHRHDPTSGYARPSVSPQVPNNELLDLSLQPHQHRHQRTRILQPIEVTEVKPGDSAKSVAEEV